MIVKINIAKFRGYKGYSSLHIVTTHIGHQGSLESLSENASHKCLRQNSEYDQEIPLKQINNSFHREKKCIGTQV